MQNIYSELMASHTNLFANRHQTIESLVWIKLTAEYLFILYWLFRKRKWKNEKI